jgi:HEAT repeat protein
MNKDEWIYLSYNNAELALALQIGRDLLREGFCIWLDRISIAPSKVWFDSIQEKQQNTNTALLLLSASYLQSDYCLQELQQFQAQNAKLIAICLDALSLEKAFHDFQLDIVLDFSQGRDTDSYQICLQDLVKILHQEKCFTAFLSEERLYLLELIATLELALSSTLTGSLVARNHQGVLWNAQMLRPRCHEPAVWLSNGQYRLYESSLDSTSLPLTNIFEALDWRSRMLITGRAGTGKTSLLQSMCLASAFHCLESGLNAAIPLYLELADYPKADNLLALINHLWPLGSEVDELLQRGAVILFLDGLGESEIELSHRTVAEIFDIERVAALVVSIREDLLKEELPEDLMVVQITELQESQVALIKASTSPQAKSESQARHLETLALNLVSQRIAGEETLEDWQQLQNILPSLWSRIEQGSKRAFTLEALTTGLENLACLSFELRQVTYIPHHLALQAMGDDLLLQLAVHLGILKAAGHRFRFLAPSLTLYLVAKRLLNDGIYQYLKHPRFDADGERLPQPWDEVIFFSLRLISADDVPLLIQSMSDIDPYFAFECAQWQSEILPASVRDIVSKLLEPHRSNLRSLSLSKRVIAGLEDKDTLLNILMEAVGGRDWEQAELAFELLIELPISGTETILQTIEAVEPEFPDSVYSVLEALSGTTASAVLAQVAIKGDLSQRLRSIYILGEVQAPIAALVLNRLRTEETSAMLIAAAKALAKVGNQHHLTFVYKLLGHSDIQVVRAAEISLLHIDKGIKTAVLRLLLQEQMLSQTIAQSLLAISDEALRPILAYILGNLGYGLSHSIDLEGISEGKGDMVRRVLDLLSSKMASLSSRDAFQDFADEMMTRMGIQHHEDLAQESNRSPMAERVHGMRASAPNQDSAQTGNQAIPERLSEAMRHEDWLVRLQALEQIANYPASLSLNLLLEAAKDSDSQVRIAALRALPREEEASLEAFLTALEDTDYQVVDAAAERLRAMDAPLTPLLLIKLHSKNDYSLATVIELLGEKGDETAVEELAHFMDDPRLPWMWSHCIGDIAVKALIGIGSVEAMQLVQQSGRIAYPVFNNIILPGIDDQIGDDSSNQFESFKLLLDDLNSESWQASQQAARQMREKAQSLRGQDNDALARMLSQSLDEPNWVLRWTVVETLAWLQAPCIIPSLLLMLGDENWMVKIASIRALVELKADSVTRQIENLLKDSNTAVREAAAEALGELADTQSLLALEFGLTDNDQFVRLAVLRSIIAHKDASRELLLVQALSDDYSHVRWYAIRALAQIAEAKHMRSIVPLLRDNGKPAWEKYTISNYAELALRRIGSAASEDVLRKWAKVKNGSK